MNFAVPVSLSTKTLKLVLLALVVLALLLRHSLLKTGQITTVSSLLTPWHHWQPMTSVREQEHPHNQNETLGIASQIFVLSLSNRTDRRRDMEHLRTTLGLRWTYIEAMDISNPLVIQILNSVQKTRDRTVSEPFVWPEDFPAPDDYIEPWYPGFLESANTESDPGPDLPPLISATQNNTFSSYKPMARPFSILTPARIACWYSHLSVIQAIANDVTLRARDVAVIFEDDLNMERDIIRRLEHVWSFLPPDWDIVYLGHCWSDESFLPALNSFWNDTERNHKTYLHPSKSPLCSHAYALSRAGARRLLIHLRYPPFAFSRAIDVAVSWLIQSGRIKSFSIVPSIVIQRKIASSDIMPGKGSVWKDQLVDGVFEQ